MSVSKATLYFALFIFIGYQAGFTLAYRMYPSALMLVIFPAWLAAIGFVFITLPVGYIHSALVTSVLRRKARSSAAISALMVSTTVVLPVIVSLCCLVSGSFQSSFGGGMFAPEGDAFTVSNATKNVIVKYGVTFIVAGWGSTVFLLRERSRKLETAS